MSPQKHRIKKKERMLKMPYVDTTSATFFPKIREDDIQQAFGVLLEKYGWKTVKRFKKAVTSMHFMSKGHPKTARHNEYFVVAEHYIYQNADGKMLGLALVADFIEFTDHDKNIPYYDWEKGLEEEKKLLLDWFNVKYKEHRANTTLYFYMVEKEPDVEDGAMLLTPWAGAYVQDNDPDFTYSIKDQDEMLRMALDVEVLETDYDYNRSYSEQLYIKRATPTVMQSPIVKTSIRPSFIETIDYPYMYTNWWSDSEIGVKGFIDSKSIFVVLQADNVPAWEDNVVPTIPLYFGNIEPMDEGDEAVALFAGTLPTGKNSKEISEFDFGSTQRGGTTIMPILKTYPRHPSNGVDTVMVSRSQFGARYQEYFLSWNVAPNEMPPQRVGEDGKRQYPRAYNNPDTPIYKYQFSPSKYSNKVHTSRIYLVHPEEGVRGYLRHSIGLNSTNFNAGKLRVRKENCPEKVFDVYRYIPVSALSPLTKRPGTAYTPMGLGIYESLIDPRLPKPDPKDTTPPTDVTIKGAVSNVAGEIKVSWENPEDLDFQHVNIYINDETEPYVTGVVGAEGYVIKGLVSGDIYTVTITTVDINGNESDGVTTENIMVV